MIATKKGLENLLRWYWLECQPADRQPNLLQGWRREYGLVLIDRLQHLCQE